MAPKFGTSGLRGLVVDLTDEVCASYTRAFLQSTAHDGVMVVAGDLRPSTRAHLRAVAAGARSLGIRVVDCGAIPTPALALEAQRRGAPGVMITGSHIPADRNGLKFYTIQGEITKADEEAIAAGVTDWTGELDLLDPERDDAADTRYLTRYTDFFGSKTLAGRTVGLYTHSAVGRDLLRVTLERLGAQVYELGRSDQFIPVDTEAVTPETRKQLAIWAAEQSMDAIVSTDGDSDRPLVTDASGQVIAGDILGALTARHLGAQRIVTPVSSNTMAELMDDFENVHRTRIGSPYVIAGIQAELEAHPGAKVVGYEANGGFLIGFDAPHLPALMTRDAILPILCALAGIADHGPLRTQLDALPPRATAADRISELPSEVSSALIAKLIEDPDARASFFDMPVAEKGVDLTDGLRVTFGNNEIVHLRPSGNAPELRCYAEAESETRATMLVERTLAAIAARYLTANSDGPDPLD